MAGAFSGHLLRSYQTNPGIDTSMVTSGSVSFNSTMHGNPGPSFSLSGAQLPFTPAPFANESISEETAMRIAALQVKLNQKLGPEYISQRPGPKGAQKLTYAEGWKIINLANEVFGFSGWSSSVVSVTTDFADRTESGRFNVGVTAVVRVTLREGAYHEDLGYGTIDNSPNKGQAFDKCKKEAVTDGLKRALRNFGNLMGNCLYDKAYTQEVVKMKVPPAKFERSELHRRPEFAEEVKPPADSTSASIPPIPPNPNLKTSPSTSASSSSTTRQPAPIDRKQTGPNSRPSMSSRPSVNNSLPSMPITTTAQSASHTLNENLQHPQQPQPQQLQQVQNRHISFAESSRQNSGDTSRTSAEPAKVNTAGVKLEDSFDFGDDDEFLAALGMAEGDLGRPIETEADLGQPFDQEENLITSDGDTSIGIVSIGDTSIRVSKNDIPPSDKATRAQRLQQEILNAELSRNTNPLFTSPPLQESTPVERAQSVSSNPPSNNQVQIASRQPYAISHQNQPTHERRHQSLSRPSPIPNQNENPSSGLFGGLREKRSSMPSTGGFYFPPGVSPLQTHNTGAQQGQATGSGNLGVKRPADVMSNPGNSGTNASGSRISKPGMGLQQAVPLRRETFTLPEGGQGGDVKRLKR